MRQINSTLTDKTKMLLDSNFKSSDYAGRRMTMITPCKRSAARGKWNPVHLQPRSGLNCYAVPVVWSLFSPRAALRLHGVINV